MVKRRITLIKEIEQIKITINNVDEGLEHLKTGYVTSPERLVNCVQNLIL